MIDHYAERAAMCMKALCDLGVPYYWGGNDPPGMDCSGAALRWCRAGNIAIGDKRAGEMYARFDATDDPKPGDFAFYGKLGKPATHVVMVLGVDRSSVQAVITIIGSNDGGSISKNELPADYRLRMKRRRAGVKIEASHLYRQDFMGFRTPPFAPT